MTDKRNDKNKKAIIRELSLSEIEKTSAGAAGAITTGLLVSGTILGISASKK